MSHVQFQGDRATSEIVTKLPRDWGWFLNSG